jgi:hypothetical protein
MNWKVIHIHQSPSASVWDLKMEFYNKGIQIIKTAIDLDEQEKYDEAFKTYVRGIEYLLTGLKCLVNLNIDTHFTR